MILIFQIANYLFFFPLIIGFFLFKKLDKTMKYFLIFLSIIAISEITALYFAYMFKYNLTVINISHFFKLCAELLLFSTFKDIKIKNFNIQYLFPFFIIIWIVFYSTGIDSIYNYTSYSSIPARIICLTLEILYLFNLSTYNKKTIYKYHIFWILLGIITIDIVSAIISILFLFISIYEILNILILAIITHFIAYPSFTLAFYFYNKQYNENIKNQLS